MIYYTVNTRYKILCIRVPRLGLQAVLELLGNECVLYTCNVIDSTYKLFTAQIISQEFDTTRNYENITQSLRYRDFNQTNSDRTEIILRHIGNHREYFELNYQNRKFKSPINLPLKLC